MPTITTNRAASTAERAAEMDRRGAVIEGLETEVARLRQALEFYAIRTTYVSRIGMESPIYNDNFGDRARSAIKPVYASPPSASKVGGEADEALSAEIVQRVAELPDRTSPDDWPDAMLVTAGELAFIIKDALASSPVEPGGWLPMDSAPKDGTPILAWCPIAPLFGDTDATPDAEARVVWWETRGQWTSDRDLGNEVFTHWMPLPPSPKGGE